MGILWAYTGAIGCIVLRPIENTLGVYRLGDCVTVRLSVQVMASISTGSAVSPSSETFSSPSTTIRTPLASSTTSRGLRSSGV